VCGEASLRHRVSLRLHRHRVELPEPPPRVTQDPVVAAVQVKCLLGSGVPCVVYPCDTPPHAYFPAGMNMPRGVRVLCC
jgi:hypothetical protein